MSFNTSSIIYDRLSPAAVLLALSTLILKFTVPGMAAENHGSTVELTPEEQAWLKAHPDIIIGYNDAFELETIVNSDGTHSSLVAEYRNQRDILLD